VTSRARLILIYALVGPVVGALLYVGFSAAAGALGIRTNVFMDPGLFRQAMAQTAGVAGWQIAISAPLSLTPALATGWFTLTRIEKAGSCPWWLSCLYGALASGPPGVLFLWAARLAYPEMAIIPHPLPGGLLIGLIGFLGTWPCWWLAARKPPLYRSSPQNL
jgi:hypothetical protein